MALRPVLKYAIFVLRVAWLPCHGFLETGGGGGGPCDIASCPKGCVTNSLGGVECICDPGQTFHQGSCVADCPTSWKKLAGKCYTLFPCTDETDFCRPATAKEKCQAEGGRVTRVGSRDVNDLLVSMANGSAYAILIDGTRDQTTKSWQFDANTRMNYTNWAPGEPVVRATNSWTCVGISLYGGYVGQWFPYACSLHNHYTDTFACEKTLN